MGGSDLSLWLSVSMCVGVLECRTSYFPYKQIKGEQSLSLHQNQNQTQT